jgi:pimeloyl-ACP methyl ester carboxylesterase
VVLRRHCVWAAISAASLLCSAASVGLAGPNNHDRGESTRSYAYAIALQPAGSAPVRLHVEETGTGPPLLLLHGMGGSGYTFRHIVGPLARTHRVITLDLKGFGASEKPLDAAYHPRDQAQLVAAFLRQRRLHGVTLLGHSFGGAVALLTVLDLNRSEPGRISRLVLMNVPAYPQALPAAQRFLTLPVLPYIALAVVPPILNTRAILQAKRRSIHPATDADAIAYAEPLYEAGGRHALIATVRAITDTDGRDVIPFYRSIRQPALLIWCREDPTVPLATGERLVQALPRARLQILDRCDHSPAEEQPIETQSAIRQFLARH